MSKAAKRDYNRLKVVLAEKKRTNKDLAEHLNIRPGTVSRWCTNDSQPNVATLFKIAKYLDVKVGELLLQ